MTGNVRCEHCQVVLRNCIEPVDIFDGLCDGCFSNSKGNDCQECIRLENLLVEQCSLVQQLKQLVQELKDDNSNLKNQLVKSKQF